MIVAEDGTLERKNINQTKNEVAFNFIDKLLEIGKRWMSLIGSCGALGRIRRSMNNLRDQIIEGKRERLCLV
jgi:hypothetical protein